MRVRAVRLMAAATLWVLSSFAHAQRVVCEIRPQPAFVGQAIRFYVQVKGAAKAQCQLEPVDGLKFELDDQGVTNQSTQMTIVNGRRTVRESADYTFVYRVAAARPGRFVIPPVRVTANGTTLRGTRVTLTVDDPADDDRAAVELRCEPPHVVLGQDAKLVVDVFLKQLPSELRARDPLDLYDRSDSFFDRGTAAPVLTLPWLTTPPQGLGPIDLEGWVRGRQSRRGFQLAGVRGGRFLEPAGIEDVERDDGKGGKLRYRRYRFGFDIRGEVAGTYDFAPAVLEGPLVWKNQSRYVWRDGFARSAPLQVEVLEPPLEGRPATFSGAVGSFSFEMEPPTPTLIPIGDAVYVTLITKGQGFLKGVGLDLGAQLGDRFRVERVGVTDSLPPGAEQPPGFPDRPGYWRQWDFKVYPISAQVQEIPAVAFSWYEPERRTYATESTEAVPITVRASTGDADVVVAGRSNENAIDVELVPTSALSANVTDLNLLGDQSPRPWLWLTILLVLPVAYVSLAFFVRRARRLRDDPALLRRKRARARATQRLRATRGTAGPESIVAAHDALCGYVADLTDRDENALTGDDLLSWLAANDVDDALCDRVRALCSAVEAASYGGGVDTGLDVPELIAELERIIGGTRTTRVSSVLGLIVISVAAGSISAQDTERLNQAQAAFAQRDFDQAAELYERVLDGGYENGYVLYNLGNAHLRRGALGESIAAYRRASLYLPGDANLDVNLRRALEARATPLSRSEDRSLIDYVLFWRPHLAFGDIVQLTLLAGLLAFGLAIARLLSGRPMPTVRWTAVLLCAATVLLATSAALDYEELVTKDRGVVTVEGAILRTGPGETFDARYEQPLGAGDEFDVQSAREGWLKVRAGGKYEGWLPATAVARW